MSLKIHYYYINEELITLHNSKNEALRPNHDTLLLLGSKLLEVRRINEVKFFFPLILTHFLDLTPQSRIFESWKFAVVIKSSKMW